MLQLFLASKELLPKLVPAICRGEEREGEQRHRRLQVCCACQAGTQRGKRKMRIPEPVLKATASRVALTAQSPALSTPNTFPATSCPPEQQILPPFPRHLCHLPSSAPTLSHQLKHGWLLRWLGSQPENPSVGFLPGICEEESKPRTPNVCTLLMHGDAYAENSTRLAGSGLCRFSLSLTHTHTHTHTHTNITPCRKQRYARRNSHLGAVSARWQSLAVTACVCTSVRLFVCNNGG